MLSAESAASVGVGVIEGIGLRVFVGERLSVGTEVGEGVNEAIGGGFFVASDVVSVSGVALDIIHSALPLQAAVNMLISNTKVDAAQTCIFVSRIDD